MTILTMGISLTPDEKKLEVNFTPRAQPPMVLTPPNIAARREVNTLLPFFLYHFHALPLLLLLLLLGVWKVEFSPVDRVLVSSSADRTLRLWSVSDYSCLRSFEGHTASVLCVKFMRKGMQLLSGSADGLLRLWNVSSGECINTFDNHEDKVWSLATPTDAELSSAASWVAADEEKKDDEGKEEGQQPETAAFFLSGGSDSCIRQWVDRTLEEEQSRLQEQEDLLLHSQQLDNDIRQGRYSKVSNLTPLRWWCSSHHHHHHYYCYCCYWRRC